MPTNEELHSWDRLHNWHSFTQMAAYESLVIERAEGVFFYDIEGNKYLDGAASMWCNVHGHNHPTLNAAIRAQLHKVAHTTSLGMGNAVTAQLAKRLADIAPGHLEHVFFSSDGASAIEVALKMAFQYWRQCKNPKPQKTKFVALGKAYHGDTIGAASVGGIELFHSLFEPLLFEVIHIASPDPRRLPLDVPVDQSAAYYLQELETILNDQHHQIAAMIVEPLVQCAAGMVIHPPGFLRGVRELTTKYDVLLIADEVATGFGRTGTLFACEQEQVVPDFLCLGKGLTSGYLPLAATITHSAIWQAFLGDLSSGRTLFHGHTFSGNPLGCAAALASLELFEAENTLEQLKQKIQLLGNHLKQLAGHPCTDNVRQLGLIGAFDIKEGQEGAGRKIARFAFEHGVWLRPQPQFVYVMPPLSISLEELDFMLNVVRRGVAEVLG